MTNLIARRDNAIRPTASQLLQPKCKERLIGFDKVDALNSLSLATIVCSAV
jgi:hypothetical protein